MASVSPLPLRHLSRGECLELLHRERLGRVTVKIGELPAILPVNYVLLEEDIVIRTAPGTKHSAALMELGPEPPARGLGARHPGRLCQDPHRARLRSRVRPDPVSCWRIEGASAP